MGASSSDVSHMMAPCDSVTSVRGPARLSISGKHTTITSAKSSIVVMGRMLAYHLPACQSRHDETSVYSPLSMAVPIPREPRLDPRFLTFKVEQCLVDGGDDILIQRDVLPLLLTHLLAFLGA